MTGSEYQLSVYLGPHQVATLSLVEEQLHMQYSSAWMGDGFALSPHLPLKANIPNTNLHRFLRNLFPEGPGFEILLYSFHLSRSNTFGIIRALGHDIPGALTVRPEAEPAPKEAQFQPLSEADIEARLNQPETSNLIVWDDKPRLSVAGVQDKINVCVLNNQQIGFGDGTLCSTHLLKFEKQPNLVLNEFVSMKLAAFCGLQVAEVDIKHFGAHPTLLVKRFDRRFASETQIERRHLIDGCQALNLPPEYKYERNLGNNRDVKHIEDGASLPKLFEFTNQCVNPALVKQSVLDWVLFNLTIFNYDAHGKNISFFVGANGITLTPFYDLVNIELFPEFADDMAMKVGDEYDMKGIYAFQLINFANECKLPKKLVMNRLTRLVKHVSQFNWSDMQSYAKTNAESEHLKQYQKLVTARCNHWIEQVGYMVDTSL